MKSRVVSTIALWALLVALLVAFGVRGAVFLVVLATALTQLEFYQMLERMGHKPYRWSGLACGVAIPLGSYLLGSERYGINNPEAGTDILILVVVVQSLIAVASPRNISERVKRFLPTLIGILCIPFMLHFFVQILLLAERHDFHEATGIMLCIWVVAVTKFSDVGALLIGSAVGRHQMAPILSPKKTWEGAVGGILFAAGTGVLILFLAKSFNADIWPSSFTLRIAFALSIPIAVAAIASDLLESAFKREANIKDSGNFIPGIGGIFDLTDSVILAGPVAYLFFKFFIFYL